MIEDRALFINRRSASGGASIPRWDGRQWILSGHPLDRGFVAWYSKATEGMRAMARAKFSTAGATRAATRAPRTSTAQFTPRQRRDQLRARARSLLMAERAARSRAEAERMVSDARLISKATRRLASSGARPGLRISRFRITGDPGAFR